MEGLPRLVSIQQQIRLTITYGELGWGGSVINEATLFIFCCIVCKGLQSRCQSEERSEFRATVLKVINEELFGADTLNTARIQALPKHNALEKCMLQYC